MFRILARFFFSNVKKMHNKKIMKEQNLLREKFLCKNYYEILQPESRPIFCNSISFLVRLFISREAECAFANSAMFLVKSIVF